MTCVKLFLDNIFDQEKVMSHSFNNAWLPRSPDLIPTNFWYWGYLKSQVYVGSPFTISELKDALQSEISAVNDDMLHPSVNGFASRL